MSVVTDGFRAHAGKRAMLHALGATALLTFAAVAWLTLHSISCKFHEGSFSNDFSRDFDISFTECRSSALKGLVFEVDGQFPYIILRRE